MHEEGVGVGREGAGRGEDDGAKIRPEDQYENLAEIRPEDRDENLAEIRPEDRYEDLIDELLGCGGVTPPRGGGGFGRTALRFQGKIFVMLVRGRLVLKLPAERVNALIAAGDGVRFDANKGTPMREWLSLDPESAREWLPLAREALDFARAAR